MAESAFGQELWVGR